MSKFTQKFGTGTLVIVIRLTRSWCSIIINNGFAVHSFGSRNAFEEIAAETFSLGTDNLS